MALNALVKRSSPIGTRIIGKQRGDPNLLLPTIESTPSDIPDLDVTINDEDRECDEDEPKAKKEREYAITVTYIVNPKGA
jgi:hypothetical protein